MKIEDKNKSKNKENSFTKEKFKEFVKDKKTRWLIIAFGVMVLVTVAQWVLPSLIK